MSGQVLNIGVWINMPGEKVGGGFNYAMDMILGIDKYQFDKSINFVFLSFPPYTEPYLKYILNKEIFKVHETPAPANNKPGSASRVYGYVKRKLGTTTPAPSSANGPKEQHLKSLKEKNIHLIFYPVQHQVLYDDFPFVSNNWDLGHLSTYSFPELSSAYEYHHRNLWYQNVFKKAFAVFTESKQGKKELVEYLQIFPEKIKIVPHFYSPQSFPELSADAAVFLGKNSLEKNEYLFYPAQFWAHKNHKNLILGFKKFIDTNKIYKNFKLVFTGSDQGNLKYITELIRELGMERHVKNLGFVSKEEISILYSNALCLIFPSFLGPSNLPLLEAIHHQCPILCSGLDGHREMCGDTALYFDPESAADISKTILKITDRNIKDSLMVAAEAWLQRGDYSVETAMKILETNFLELHTIRLCWDQ